MATTYAVSNSTAKITLVEEAGWDEPEFDDSGWGAVQVAVDNNDWAAANFAAPAGPGTYGGSLEGCSGTGVLEHPSSDMGYAYIRQSFSLTAAQVADTAARLWIGLQYYGKVYINGTLVWTDPGVVGNYDKVYPYDDIDTGLDIRSHLVEGDNVIGIGDLEHLAHPGVRDAVWRYGRINYQPTANLAFKLAIR